MTRHRSTLVCALIAPLSACGGGECAPARPDWARVAPADADTVRIDAHDRILWNGAILSQARFRDTLNHADAAHRTVSLSIDPGASCTQIETVRLTIERSLSCGQGRCVEAGAGGTG